MSPLYEREGVGEDYVQSRSQGLVTNGSGATVTQVNFSGFDVDPLDVPPGAIASFKTSELAVDKFTDETVPVDTSRWYRLAFSLKATTSGVTHTAGYCCLDPDLAEIDAKHAYHLPGTETTLAAQLNPGATTIALTSGTSWVAGAVNLQVWPYTNGMQRVYDDWSYTRNVFSLTGVTKSGNTLTIPAWAGPAVPAGSKVAQGVAASPYPLIFGSNLSTPTVWTPYTAAFSGIGTPGTATEDLTLLRPGTTSIKPYWRLNANSVPGSTSAIASVALDGDYRGVWTGVSYTNGWTTYSGGSAIQWRQEYAGTVRLRGQMSSGLINLTATAAAFTLPVGCRPSRTYYHAVRAGTGLLTGVGQVTINTDGTVRVVAGDNGLVSLDGITFATN